MRDLNCKHDFPYSAVAQIGPRICANCKLDEKVTKKISVKQFHVNNFIPAEYHDATFDNYKTGDNQQKLKALNTCKQYALEFQENLMDRNCLVLFGATGTGKTHLSFAIYRHIAEKGYDVERRLVSRMFLEIKDTYSSRKDSLSSVEVIDTFIEPELLIIDEIGRQRKDSEEEKNLTDIIFNERYEAKKPTIIISNLDKQGITDYIGATNWSRLSQGKGKILSFDWEDGRKA